MSHVGEIMRILGPEIERVNAEKVLKFGRSLAGGRLESILAALI
jgi:hypothetical protein